MLITQTLNRWLTYWNILVEAHNKHRWAKFKAKKLSLTQQDKPRVPFAHPLASTRILSLSNWSKAYQKEAELQNLSFLRMASGKLTSKFLFPEPSFRKAQEPKKGDTHRQKRTRLSLKSLLQRNRSQLAQISWLNRSTKSKQISLRSRNKVGKIL